MKHRDVVAVVAAVVVAYVVDIPAASGTYKHLIFPKCERVRNQQGYNTRHTVQKPDWQEVIG